MTSDRARARARARPRERSRDLIRARARARKTILLLSTLASSTADAAPRTPYGGEVLVYVFGAPLVAWPKEIESTAQASTLRAVYEPLYSIGDDGSLIPVLAEGPPEIDANKVTVHLRRDVLRHDGRVLAPEAVAASFQALAERRSDGRRTAGGHVLLPIAGARARLTQDTGALAISSDAASFSVSFTLAYPDASFPRRLASRHAGVVITREASPPVGTGPFRLDSADAKQARLIAFLGHRDGRPFLDAIELKRHVSRSGLLSLLRRGEAALVLGAPEAESPTPKGARPAGLELLAIRVALDLPDGLDAAAIGRLFDAALDRERLVDRFLGPGALASRTLVPSELASPADKITPPRRPASGVLRVPRSIPLSHRFLERLQLDLLRAGLSLTIERPEQESPSGAPGLELIALPLDGPATKSVPDRLSALLGVAAAVGRYDVMPDDAALAAFANAKDVDEAERALANMERGLRQSLLLVPIGFRPTALVARPDLNALAVDRQGAIVWADAFLEESP